MSHRPKKKNKKIKSKKQGAKQVQANTSQLTEYTLKLTIRAPILTAGYGATNYGLDMQTLRDHHGKQVLPGSLIKGNLRHALSELIALTKAQGASLPIDEQWVNTWFGEEAAGGTDNTPRRGKLHFDFYWQHNNVASKTLLNRIAINDAGTVDEGSLAFIESDFPIGTLVTFSGKIRCYTDTKAQRNELRNAIEKAAQFIDALGSMKSIGFGELISVSVEEASPEVEKSTQVESNMVSYNLTFDRPVCFPLRSSQGNRFESQEHISGAVIKGALAGKPRLSDLLKANLDKVRFSFVYLQNKQARQLPLRRSLVELEGQHAIRDLASEPLDIGSFDGWIAWQDDWKNSTFDKVDRVGISKTMVVRTAIESMVSNEELNLKHGTASEQQLFSYVCLMHEKDTSEDDGKPVFSPVNWQGFFDVERVAENVRERVKREIISLLAEPLFPLGKTRAVGRVSGIRSAHRTEIPQLSDESRIVVSLASPAWLHHYNLEPLAATEDLMSHYQTIFSQMSDDSLRLTDCFTSQYLSGGGYIKQRFLNGAENYQPQLITEAGSVFVFEATDKQKAQAVLTAWQRDGLPPVQAQWGTDENGEERWTCNPYNRGNGFGEIEVITHGA